MFYKETGRRTNTIEDVVVLLVISTQEQQQQHNTRGKKEKSVLREKARNIQIHLQSKRYLV